ncbi:hypothetical protein [Ottowia sp.]|uniref:hypothetical protein n=1 Tax=Ottowia sp. TaxID=1898956 RepID=UPI0025F4B0E2|nr:hypothetical protein [Ottowia sp.]MBK6616236.1 hypothetical protein [Ottowia sp.]
MENVEDQIKRRRFAVTGSESGGAKLIVLHTCGHTAKLSYGGKSFAEDDGANQAATVCVSCANSAWLASHGTKRQ